MYTADDARKEQNRSKEDELDQQIAVAVEQSECIGSATLRVWSEDWFASTIKEELEKRGFKNVSGEGGVYKWDVYFEW